MRSSWHTSCLQPVVATLKCPRQESNLDFELRGLACGSGTLQGHVLEAEEVEGGKQAAGDPDLDRIRTWTFGGSFQPPHSSVQSQHEREESNPVRQFWRLPAHPGAHSCMWARVSEGSRTLPPGSQPGVQQPLHYGHHNRLPAANAPAALDRSSRSIDKRQMPHSHRLRLGVHQHLVPAEQDDRLVIGVTHRAADKHQRVATLRNPLQRLRSSGCRLIKLAILRARVRPMRMLVADVDQSRRRAARAPRNSAAFRAPRANRLVRAGSSFCIALETGHRHEEPFTLADESFVATAVPLRGFTFEPVLQPTHGRRA